MGLFNWFGRKKPAASAPAGPTSMARELDAVAARTAAKASVALASADKVKPVASAAPPAAMAVLAASGAAQVKLRLKLAAAKRTGETAAAYAAAKSLADIQAKAGRRMAARIWKAEADRILASDPKAA